MEPSNKEHIGTRFFVLLREAVHFLEVTNVYKSKHKQCPLDGGEFLFRVSFIRGSTVDTFLIYDMNNAL